MSEVLKGVPCDDCFGTYDSHESGCRTLELEKLREESQRLLTENARMKAVVDAARLARKALDNGDGTSTECDCAHILDDALASLEETGKGSAG